ncbi:hypothetical protein EDF81_2156 [Enterobacter sp. BIGb0383]|uniref:BapA/Bap/LapF family prefix-like domain-containing protein n=1 Tax=unclassified Enterobacter TaxID=2608935 RepID=UPI000F4A4CEA|nr:MULTISPECIES: hypothetical protein [unclassified Enterobacter]ROP59357.1 hypothetical protein EDF81_2156 [Enterobacter sp. BIGb0383]ROS09177.1 hypothetical protein EC848_2684 [Enterobacter sp. BIGb0359]
MQKMEIISASGNIKSMVVGGRYNITQPGVTVKMEVPKGGIIGSQKVNNDLLLVMKDGEKVTLENFFVANGGVKNKLVLDDGGSLYVADYNSQSFAGLSFTPVASMNEVIAAEEGGISTAAWAIPLVGLAAIGGGIAIYNRNSSDDNHNNSSNDESTQAAAKALTETQAALDASSASLDASLQELEAAVVAMKATQDDASVAAVNTAKAALDEAAQALQTASTAHQTAIDNAKAKGIDTTAAEQAETAAQQSIVTATEASDAAVVLTETALALIAAATGEAFTTVQLSLASTQSDVELAKCQPTEENVGSCTQYQEQADQALAEMQELINQLEQLIQNAQEQGFDAGICGSLLSRLQTECDETALAIAEAIAQAQQNKLDLDAANEAVLAANEAMEAAVQQKAEAAGQLSAALALKAEVLENNQLDRIDEVNLSIAKANAALAAAAVAADNANAAVVAAEEAIAKVSPDVEAQLIPETGGSIDVSDLQSIDTGLQSDTHKTFFEALQDFAQSIIDSAKAIFQQILDSKPVEIIQSVISDIMDGIGAVTDVLAGKIGAVVDAVGTAFSAVGNLIGTGATFFSSLFSLGFDAVKEVLGSITEGIGAVVSGITQGVSDALSGMTLTDWINPLKWVVLVKDVIVNSVGNVFNNLVDVITALPGKFIDSVTAKIAEVGGALSTKFSEAFTIIKDSVSDVLKTVFDAFIQNPYETLLKPIIDKITDLISNPIESISSLISAIVESVKDGIDIVKSILSLPGELINNVVKLVTDIIDSFGSDSVVNGDGTEIQDLIKSVIEDSISSTDSGDINLDAILGGTAEETASETVADNVTEIATATLQIAIVTDDNLAVAA